MNWVCRVICVLSFMCAVACATEVPYQFKGVHFLASYLDCDKEALADVEGLKQAMSAAVEQCGATILDSSSWVFPPSGLTMVFLLSESHASIHTYPEWGACFVDLFTCGDSCSSEKFDAALQTYLKPQLVNQRVLVRDEGFQDKK